MMVASREPATKVIASVFFILLAFALSRQAPLNQYPIVLALSLVLFIVSQVLADKYLCRFPKYIVALFLFILAGFIFWGVINENEVKLIFRFFFIIFLMNFILLLDIKNKNYVTYFKNIYLVQAFIIVVLGVSMPLLFSIDTYAPIRQLVKGYQWGDIYTYNGYFYRIQLIGNALLPFLFFILYDRWRNGGKGIISLSAIFLSICFAGNLAFYLSVLIFVFIYELLKIKVLSSKVSTYKFIFWGSFILITPIAIMYFIQLIIMKSTGDISSIGTRIDQYHVLIDNMSVNYLTVLFGQGLGNTINVVTPHRDYTGNIYFELQFLYFLNQIGILGMILFLYTHIVLFLNRVKNKTHILMYACYCFYGFINPYMLDTTHLLVLVILISMNQSYKEKLV